MMEKEEEEGLVASAGHVSKRKRKNKGTVVVFDEDARREYVTGFRKRKKKRRKIAEKEKKVKEREVRLQKRKEKRLALREALGIPSKGATETTQEGEEVEDDEDAEETQHLVKASMVYENGEMMTIVNTCPIKGNEDLEDRHPLKERFISQDEKPIRKGHGTASQDKKPNKKVPKKNPARNLNFKKKKKGGTKRNKHKRG